MSASFATVPVSAYNTEAQYLGGEVSVTGSGGNLDYTFALSNNNDRFGADGAIFITDAAGNLIERQDSKFSGGFDNPQLSVALGYTLSEATKANLNLKYGRDYFFRNEPETDSALGPVRTRT